ncbi:MULTISPECIES: hypothetical protein [Pseudomonas]|uniref:hypothetical protein n=1 Tax=Pseudomonas TaxID=286 RepID=UPI001E36336D|nr:MULTISPECIES: hypothetical protein [Pseudomonas]
MGIEIQMSWRFVAWWYEWETYLIGGRRTVVVIDSVEFPAGGSLVLNVKPDQLPDDLRQMFRVRQQAVSEVLSPEEQHALKEKPPSMRTAARFTHFSPGKKKLRTAGQVLTIACALY